MIVPNGTNYEYMTGSGKNEHDFFIAELKGQGILYRQVRPDHNPDGLMVSCSN